MAADGWTELESLFARALALPPERRAGFLDEACGEDEDLRREVESLLRADAGAGDAVRGVVGASALGVAATLGEGATLGAYRLVRELGRGGMGAVFLAVRDDGEFEQRVAVKVMGGPLLDEATVRRFRSERQILARLEHASIARLLDGGTTDAGIPYLVMEYVEGEPIDSYCDRARCTVRRRLELFREVAAAVQHAHRNLVIHRDLKPSNILVTPEGTPKLLDFGIAKVLSPDPAMESGVTRQGTRVMTPEYASPEQIRGEAVSTATDVYALGLLLYRLLTGRDALHFESTAPAEVERVVCDVSPIRPSRNFAGPTGDEPSDRPTADRIAADRRTVPRRLRRALSGDLDRIVLKALRKEPERRYGSVEELSEDVRRYLRREPVAAHADHLTYRLGKFVRRHTAGVVATGSVLVALAGFAYFYSTGVAEERDRARLEAEKASRTAAFLIELFKVADPFSGVRPQLVSGEILDRSRKRIDRELGGEPELAAELKTALGKVYHGAGRFEAAREQLVEAVGLLESLPGDHRHALADALRALAAAEREVGDYPRAETLARRSLELASSLEPEDELLEADALQTLAGAFSDQGRYEEEGELLGRCLAIRERLLDSSHPSVIEALGALGTNRFQQGRYDEAEAIYRRGVEAARASSAASIELGWMLANLASAKANQGRSVEAEDLYREGIPLLRRKLGGDHPELAEILRNMARTLMHNGKPVEARALMNETLRIQVAAYGPDHHEVAKTSFNRGELLEALGELDEAERSYRRCVELIEKAVGRNHPHFGRAISGVASVELALGRLDDAERDYRTAVTVLREHLPPGHDLTATAEVGLGRTLAAAGRCEEARPLLLSGHAALEALAPDGHPVSTLAERGLERCPA